MQKIFQNQKVHFSIFISKTSLHDFHKETQQIFQNAENSSS